MRELIPSVVMMVVMAMPLVAGPPSVTWNGPMIAGWDGEGPDPEDPVAVFGVVFGALPDEVTVYPTENYYYWELQTGGRTLRGNLRLASGRRERGELCFGYAEGVARLDEEREVLTKARWFGAGDGVEVKCEGAMACVVRYGGKTVRFRFGEVSQTAPEGRWLREGERFVERTCDESGLRFLLLCDVERRAFVWVLDPAVKRVEPFDVLGEGLEIGRRTGFVYFRDEKAGGRRVLAAVSDESVRRNDWHDGPFDQLADNYADQSGIRGYLELVMPTVRGKIDRFGNFTDDLERGRVAIVPYGRYGEPEEVVRWLRRARGRELEALHEAQGGLIEPR